MLGVIYTTCCGDTCSEAPNLSNSLLPSARSVAPQYILLTFLGFGGHILSLSLKKNDVPMCAFAHNDKEKMRKFEFGHLRYELALLPRERGCVGTAPGLTPCLLYLSTALVSRLGRFPLFVPLRAPVLLSHGAACPPTLTLLSTPGGQRGERSNTTSIVNEIGRRRTGYRGPQPPCWPSHTRMCIGEVSCHAFA